MSRKKIGLFMSEITQFFQQACGRAVIDLSSLHDMDVVVFASYGSYTSPYGRNLLSEISKKNIIQLPDYSTLDAIIALPNTFDINGMDSEFYELVRANAKCPVICLQTGQPDFYTVSIENKNSMYSVTKHFIEDHNFTDICYMSGPFDHKDSPERLEGFLQALRESGIAVGENTVYEGNYWLSRGAKALDFFMNGRISYPQAIICANDYMAISIIDELKKRNIRVPQDVCVSGFDGIREGEYATPSLTTVTVSPERFAEVAFGILDDIDAGLIPDKNITVPNEVVYRASCGCGYQLMDTNAGDTFRKLLETENLLREAGRIPSDYQNTLDIKGALSVANYYFALLGCKTGYICYCDESDPKFFSVEREFPFTDKMLLLQVMQSNNRQMAEVKGEMFLRKDILPPEYFETDEPGTYFVFPLFFKNKIYGYLVLKPDVGQWPNELTYNYISTLSSAIENCYYQKRFSDFAEIKKLSQTDELTGLNNRRGFANALEEILSGESVSQIISIISIDMDNLKQINDVYGHAEGDFALKQLSRILKKCLNMHEVCARFGGDEFSAVLISDDPRRGDEFIAKFNALMEKTSAGLNKPYSLHASIGVSELTGRDTNHIVASMKEADEKMYLNKRENKSGSNGDSQS